MSEVLGVKEQENLRMELNKKLQNILAGKTMAETVKLLGAEDFCEYEGKGKNKIVKFKIKEFVDFLIKTGKTDILNNFSEIKKDGWQSKETKNDDQDYRSTIEMDEAPEDWMNAEEIETYLKKFNPKITRKTLKKWIKEMGELNKKDCDIFKKNKNIPSTCYSPRIIQKLQDRLLTKKQPGNWMTVTEIARELQKNPDWHASPEIVSSSIENLGLIYGHDYEERVDKMDRDQTHYSEYVLEQLKKLLKGRGEKAPDGWKTLNAMIEEIKSKHPDELDPNKNYRKRVGTYLAGLGLEIDKDISLFLTTKNQSVPHFSPEIVAKVERFLITKTTK